MAERCDEESCNGERDVIVTERGRSFLNQKAQLIRHLIIPSDELRSSILYVLLSIQVVRQLGKKAGIWGAGRHIEMCDTFFHAEITLRNVYTKFH